MKPVSLILFSFLALVLIIVFLQANFGILREDLWVKKGWITKREAEKDPTLDLYGWAHINNYFIKNEVNPENTFLFTHKWYLSGELELATAGKYKVMCFNQKDSRGYGIWDAELDMLGKDGLFICTNRYRANPYKNYNNFFKSISVPDSIVVNRHNRYAKTIYIYKCNNLLKKYPVPYRFENNN